MKQMKTFQLMVADKGKPYRTEFFVAENVDDAVKGAAKSFIAHFMKPKAFMFLSEVREGKDGSRYLSPAWCGAKTKAGTWMRSSKAEG